MQLVQVNQNFTFNYTAYDQNPDLFVAFNVYDVTTGTPVFLEKVISDYTDFGVYVGSFFAEAGKSYAVIGIVYTSNTYTTPDNSRGPTGDAFQTFGRTTSYLVFLYGTYDQVPGLDIQATVYNCTTGSPVFEATVELSEVAFGVYLGTYDGAPLNSYEIASVVYTDNTFTTPDLARAPSTEDFEGIVTPIGVIGSANLVGQRLSAILVGDT